MMINKMIIKNRFVKLIEKKKLKMILITMMMNWEDEKNVFFDYNSGFNANKKKNQIKIFNILT